MGKLAPVKVLSDDCEVKVAGETYNPHEGEWIMALRGLSVNEIRLMQRLQTVKVQIEALEGEANEDDEVVRLLVESFEPALNILKHRVTSWNWTDDASRPLAQPTEDPDVFSTLSVHEVWYLVAAVRGETAGEQGND